MKDGEEASRTVTKHVRAGTPYLGNLWPINLTELSSSVLILDWHLTCKWNPPMGNVYSDLTLKDFIVFTLLFLQGVEQMAYMSCQPLQMQCFYTKYPLCWFANAAVEKFGTHLIQSWLFLSYALHYKLQRVSLIALLRLFYLFYWENICDYPFHSDSWHRVWSCRTKCWISS